jgi:hypothetical protein
MPPVGSLVRVLTTSETVALGFAEELGEVIHVGAPASLPLAKIPGSTTAADAVLVELHDLARRNWFGSSVLCVEGVELNDEGPVDPSATRVRVRATTVTVSLGYAGLTGEVVGDTRPSFSGISDVVGLDDQDFAFSVLLDDLGEQRWFAPNLLEQLEARPESG